MLDRLYDKKKQLRDEKKQLRDKEKQLYDIVKELMQKQLPDEGKYKFSSLMMISTWGLSWKLLSLLVTVNY